MLGADGTPWMVGGCFRIPDAEAHMKKEQASR